jgi:CHAT domain-containing protein
LADYARALVHYERALALRQQALPPGHPDIAQSLTSIALVYADRGEHAQALAYHGRALALKQKALPPGHPAIAASLRGIAAVYRDRGDHSKALEYHERALALYEQALPPGHPVIADSLDNIAVVCSNRGDYARALGHHERALALRRQALPPGHPDIADSLHNIAVVYHARGDHARALAYSERALECMRHPVPHGPDVPVVRASGDRFRPDPTTLRIARQRFELLSGTLPPAPGPAALRACVRAYDLAAGLHDRVRSELLGRDDSRLHAAAEGADLLPRHLLVLRDLYDREGQPEDLRAAVAAVERSRARVFADHLARARASLLAGAPPALRDRELDLHARLRALDRQTRALLDRQGQNPTGRPEPDFPERLARLDAERQEAEEALENLVAQIGRAAPGYAALRYPQPCSFDQARACLRPNEVALWFAPGQSLSCVLLLEGRPDPADKARGVAIYRLPGTAEFADKVATLTDPEFLRQDDDARALGAELYRLLLGPVAKRIKGKDLVLVPDGVLCHLPFELLAEGDKYLIESHRIRYAPSLSALHAVRQWERARGRPDRPLFALGDPVFGPDDERLTGLAAAAGVGARGLTTAGPSLEDLAWREGRTRGEGAFHRLRHSGKEVADVAVLLKADPRDVLTGFDATLANVQRASASGRLAGARYVHLATHGVLGLADGQQPALVLGLPAGAGPAERQLRMDEAAGLRLNADLVVLSACRTGRGRLDAAEGVTGLARAFLAAGSRGVVCSLWAVDDQETARLMVGLYAGLRAGPAADALRAAKLAMIQAGKPPLYWAPFILIGE